MYKKYQIKWLLILSGIIFLFTSFLVQVDLNTTKWWHFFDHGIKIFIPIAGCWLVDGYFITNNFSHFSSTQKTLLSILLGTLVIFLLGIALFMISPKNHLFQDQIGYSTSQELGAHLIGNTLLSMLCYFVFSNRHTSTVLKITKIEKDLLEQEHLRAQLMSLQQQISPHFLFNSLSTLKTLVSEPLARDYIVHLASVYRYLLSFHSQHLTKLEEELHFIHSYVYILHERFGNMLTVTIDVSDQDKSLLLPSLSLQLLVENAIKHNICSEEKPLFISISTTENQELKVENNFQPKSARPERPGIDLKNGMEPKNGLEPKNGMGLKNIIERYKILDDQPVTITQTSDQFIVTLPLLKNESNYHRR